MFKYLLLIFAVAVSVESQTDRTASTMMANIIQPTRSQTGFTYSDSIYRPSNHKWCKAAELRKGGAAGYIEVHLINDPDTIYYQMPMTPGARSAAMFDKIRERNTTAAYKDSVVLFFNEPY